MKWWGVMACSEDLKTALNSYRVLFDKEPAREWEGCFSFQSENGKFYVMEAPTMAPYLVLSTDDIEGEINRLREAGCEVMDSFEVKTGKFTFFTDILGNQFGLHQDTDE